EPDDRVDAGGGPGGGAEYDDQDQPRDQRLLGPDPAGYPVGDQHGHRGDDEVAGEQQRHLARRGVQLVRDGWQDRVDQADAHERHDAGERDGEDSFRLSERARDRTCVGAAQRVLSSVRVSGSGVTSRCALASASMAGSAAPSAARSCGLIRSRITANRSARTARRRASVSRPWSVSRTWTTRPSAASASRPTSPVSSRRAISCVMAGCVTPPWTATPASRRGPDRSSVASVAAAVADSPSAGLSDLSSPISRSTPAAIPAASARWDPAAIAPSAPGACAPSLAANPPAISISNLYHF